MTNPTARVSYALPDGTRIVIPRLPIDRAGLPVPGPVTRPDGRVVWVEDVGEERKKVA
jgi:hypothetical protein